MKFRDFFFNRLFTLRSLFFIANFLVLLLFMVALARDYFQEWKPYQVEFIRREKARIKESMEKAEGDRKSALEDEMKNVKARRIEIKQIWVSDFNRVDRCVTCHQGYDSYVNPSLTTIYQDQPYAAPENEIHKRHPPEKYGCTVCHEGQGLATTFVDAGHMPKSEEQKQDWIKRYHWKVVEHWEDPMKAGPQIYATCSKCHEAAPHVQGMEIVKKGKLLFHESGCVGCHQIHGVGGPIAPDLAEETAVKPLERIDFGYAVSAGLIAKDEGTLENWIRLHFATNPAVLSPGDPLGRLSPNPKHPAPVAPTAMPYFGFSKEQAESLVAYITSLRTEKIPYSYRVTAAPETEPVFPNPAEHGRYVFFKYGCAGCHGKDADHGIPVFNRQGGKVPDLVKTVGTFTREELVKKIQEGVNPEDKEDPEGAAPPLYMPAWKEKIKGHELEDLVTYLMSIAQKQEAW